MAPDQFHREVLDFSLEQAASSARLALGVAVIVAAIAVPGVGYLPAAVWAVAVIAALLVRTRLLRSVRPRLVQAGGASAANSVLTRSTLVLAALLGILPALAFPLMSAEMKMLLTLFFCCWCAAGMSSIGVTPMLYSGYLLLVLGGLSLGWLRSAGIQAPYIVIGLTIYGMVLHAFARNFARRILEGISIRAQNADLVRKLSAANEAKTRFIMAASHDLRQPLHAISLLCGVLSRDQQPEDSKNAREALDTAVDGLSKLFSAILDLSRLESGVVRISKAPFAVDDLIARLDGEYRALCLSSGRRWECQTESAIANTDAMLLERVLRNLLDNALKHGGQGAVRLAVSSEDGDVVLAVCDAGPGIPVADRERVFDEFYRGNDVETGQAGLGLGLSIVKKLTTLLDYRMSVDFLDPVAQTGTCIALRLPAAAQLSSGADAHGPAGPEADLSGMAILVIDDERPVLEATRALLTQWNCHVAVCRGEGDLQAALEKLGEPDVVVTDYRLGPASLGLDVIAGVRAKYPEMGVVVVTGESDEAVLARLVESGLPVLEKPVSPAELRSTLAMFKTVSDSD